MPLTAEERAALKKSVESATKPKPRLTPLSESEGRALDKANGILPATARDETVEKSFGFAHFGEFLHEVKKSPNKSQPSERLAKAFGHDTVMKAAAGMGELIGSDGGFLVPPEFSNKIFERMYTENNLLGKTDQYTAAGNQMVFPRNNESSRATGSRWGGVRAYWVQEGDTITASTCRSSRASPA
jgi:HK97 family phage major capsid protein